MGFDQVSTSSFVKRFRACLVNCLGLFDEMGLRRELTCCFVFLLLASSILYSVAFYAQGIL